MPETARTIQIPTAPDRSSQAVLLVSLELSYKSWLVTSLSPGSEKMSKHIISGGDMEALLDLLRRLRAKAEKKYGQPTKVVVIQEIGLDGFWIHRVLVRAGIESNLVDPASIAVSRRHRRGKDRQGRR